MDFDPILAAIAGAVAAGTMIYFMTSAGVFTGIHTDLSMTLGSLFLRQGMGAYILGVCIQVIAGAALFLIYAALFSALGLEDEVVLLVGTLLGAVQAFVLGATRFAVGEEHFLAQTAGGPEQETEPMNAGPFATKLGARGPVSIFLAHMLFGLVGSAVYFYAS